MPPSKLQDLHIWHVKFNEDEFPYSTIFPNHPKIVNPAQSLTISTLTDTLHYHQYLQTSQKQLPTTESSPQQSSQQTTRQRNDLVLSASTHSLPPPKKISNTTQHTINKIQIWNLQTKNLHYISVPHLYITTKIHFTCFTRSYLIECHERIIQCSHKEWYMASCPIWSIYAIVEH